MRALLDTNVLVDYLNGVEAAREEIDRYDEPMISPLTWMEVMVGAEGGEQEPIRMFLRRFPQIAIDAGVAEVAVAIRRERRLRLPEAIVWASARCENALLVTRNTKDFPADSPGVRVPYRL